MGGTLWMLGTDEAPLSDQLESRLAPGFEIPALQSFAISAKFGSHVAVSAPAKSASAEETGKLADVLRGLRALVTLQ